VKVFDHYTMLLIFSDFMNTGILFVQFRVTFGL